uniref:Phosphodiesterase n=1 Tax=Aceria tosichella TaxID=561515 RepID=A0A6G1S439_9ACAR
MTPSFININTQTNNNIKQNSPTPKCAPINQPQINTMKTVHNNNNNQHQHRGHHRRGQHNHYHKCKSIDDFQQHRHQMKQSQIGNNINPLTANLFASNVFRRRSYDDQEGDNDINIILQPSDIDEIEKQARASYARWKATAAAQMAAEVGPGGASSTTTTSIASLAPNQTTTKGLNDTIDTDTDDDVEKQRQRNMKLNRHKQQRQQKQARALDGIFEDIKLAKCLLDQDYYQTVRLFIERSALNWNFNSFTFDALCCGKSLTELLLHLFDYYNLYATFKLDIIKVLKCFRLLEFGYHSTNPYHNSVHAADVTQAMHCFIQEQKIRCHMTDLEILCSILAAVCHDLDHPGVNQSFLVATKNPLASLYNNNSVLENHHWRFALCIFKEAELFDHFEQPVLDDMKQQLKQLILATDIARQNDYLKRFKALTSSNKFSMSNTEDRALVLQMALKCADLGNPCRPWLISRVWSNLICDEFYRMGAIERRLGVPLTPICQRDKTSIAGIQTDFFRFIVLPLLELWHNFLGSPLSGLLMANFDHNYKRWQRANRIVQQLRRRKSVASLEPVRDADLDTDYQDNCHRMARSRQARSLSLFQSTMIGDCGITTTTTKSTSHNNNHHQHHYNQTRRDSFELIKRASSDYVKSGNGGLELLRDFQLNRIIEKSPVITRSSRTCLPFIRRITALTQLG